MNVEELLRELTDDEPETRLQAVLSASDAGEGPLAPMLVEALTRRLDDQHPGVQQAALETLTRLVEAGRATVDRRALDRAIDLTTHGSALVRTEAVGALAVFCPDLEEPLRAGRVMATLTDPAPEVRRMSAAACGDLGLRDATDTLVHALGDPELRFEAAFALATLGDPRARPTLENALTKTQSRLDALEGLRRLGDPAAIEAVRPFAEGWFTAWVDRLSALATLHVLGAPEAAEQLLARAGSRRMEERVYALFLLGRYRMREGRVLLEKTARTPNDQRETALDALSYFDDAEAATLLSEIAQAEQEDGDTRIAATRALRRMTHAVATQAIVALSESSDPAIRSASG